MVQREWDSLSNNGLDGRGEKGITNPLKGKNIHFNSVEEERDYYKAQVEYLKKQYPNL